MAKAAKPQVKKKKLAAKWDTTLVVFYLATLCAENLNKLKAACTPPSPGVWKVIPLYNLISTRLTSALRKVESSGYITDLMLHEMPRMTSQTLGDPLWKHLSEAQQATED